MNNYFLVKIKFEKAENGKLLKVSEQYIVEALSFTEAEARINEEMQPFISGEFEVVSISKQKINEIFGINDPQFEGDRWFKAKVNLISLDEEKGIEKKIAENMLVFANNINHAENNLHLEMKGSMPEYEITSITETKIIGVFKL